MFQVDKLRITAEMLQLIAEIDEFKGAWRALGRVAPERLTKLRRIATIQSIGSSTRIEGGNLSDREVERLLENLEIKSYGTRDEQEVAGYAEVMESVFHAYDEIAVSENWIKQLHRDVLRYSEKDERHRGEYKKLPNSILAFSEKGEAIAVVLETATPFETPQRMQELVAWFRETQAEAELHPLLAIAIFTVVFLEIHPFEDGNGRLSRVLTTLLLLKAGYAYVPYFSLEGVIERSKDGYYRALRQTQSGVRQTEVEWNPWLIYFLRSMQEQARGLTAKVEREQLLLAALPELDVKIVEFVREFGRVTMGEMMRATGVNRNTLKDHFKSLVHKKHLARHGKGKGAWYSQV